MACAVAEDIGSVQARSPRKESGEKVRVQTRPRTIARCHCGETIVRVVGYPAEPVVLLASLDDSQHIRDELKGGRGVFTHDCHHVYYEGLTPVNDVANLPLAVADYLAPRKQ